MADLADTLANLGLGKTCIRHHTLHLSYPATELLPPNTAPWLELPRNLVYREQPYLNTFLLADDDLDYFHRFRVQSTSNMAPARLEDFGSSCEGLILTVESLKDQPPGRSKLDFVAYDDGLDGLVYIFRLLVNLHGARNAQVRYFRISKMDIATLYSAAEQGGWASLVIDLLERGSDRAFLQVQQNLQAQHQGYALGCEMSHAPVWGTCYPPSARQMLRRSLVHEHGSNGVTLLSDLDDENLQAHSDQELDVWPPCGHKTSVTIRKVRSLTEEECLSIECNECERLILTPADSETIDLGKERAIRDEYIQSDLYWAGLEEPISSNDTIATQFATADIGEALLEALGTLRVPTSATPASLSAVHFPETAVAVAGLHETLQSAGDSLKVVPGELMCMLVRKAVDAIALYYGESKVSDIDLPLGYIAWLERWMRRTVNTVSEGSRKRMRKAVIDLGELLDKARVA